MHIHGNPMPSSVHSAPAAEKAASAQGALETRKKLMKSALEIGDAAAFGEILMVGRWPEKSSSGHHEQPYPSKQTQAGDEDQAAKPVSFWA